MLVRGEQQLREITGGMGMKAFAMAHTNRNVLSRNITLLSGLEQPGPCRTHQCHHCELDGNKWSEAMLEIRPCDLFLFFKSIQTGKKVQKN